jgi:hypothetical protein
MTQVSEVTEQENTSQELPKQTRVGVLLAFAKMLLKNPKAIKSVMVFSDDEKRYVRPPRQYEIPPFRDDMQYCTSNEKYLRPTRFCNPRDLEVIAMANELGAFELSDHEFADAAYWFVKTKMVAEMLPLDSVGATLKRGTGTCWHWTNVFIALCRAAGIKARYKEFSAMLSDLMSGQAMIESLNLGTEQEITATGVFNTTMTHGEAEVCIDGKWVVANVGLGPEIHALSGAPITKFGEDAIDNFTTAKLIPGTIKRFESIPLSRGISMKVWMLAPVLKERSSISFQGTALQGRKIIEEAGGIEAYDQNARRRRGELSSIEEEITRLTQEAKRQQVVEFVE